MSSPALWEDTIQPGSSWSLILRRGRELLLEDLEGGANVAAVFYNFDCPAERYNIDTLKAQHAAHLKKAGFLFRHGPNSLLDHRGQLRVARSFRRAQRCDCRSPKYGPSSYQKQRNAWHRNTRDNFLIELGRYGLGIRDLPPNVNFFSKIVVGDTGAMEFVPATPALATTSRCAPR